MFIIYFYTDHFVSTLYKTRPRYITPFHTVQKDIWETDGGLFVLVWQSLHSTASVF